MDYALIQLVNQVFNVIWYLVLIACILSWIPTLDRRNPFVQFIHRVTEPLLSPFRRLVPPQTLGGLDISPLLLLLVLQLIRELVIRGLGQL